MILYIFYHDFIHVYILREGADNPLGTQFWCQQEPLVTSVIPCKFKKSPWSLILYNKCSLAGVDSHRGQSFDVNRYVLSLHSFVASLKKNVFEIRFYTFLFLHDLIHVAPAQGPKTDPRGLNFGANRKALSLFPFVASFKEISFKSGFIQMFSRFNTCT